MQYHSYIFFSSIITPLKKDHQEFLDLLKNKKSVLVYTYATLGLKADTNVMLWIQADTPEDIQDFIKDLLHTKLGQGLRISYSLFGMVRPTQYSKDSKTHLETERKGCKFLIIYPFTKTKEWYQISFEERKNLMWGHVQIGRKHPEVEQILLYSYGVDDSEFVVSYETDDLLNFQTLVMELRSDKVREYTLKDTPIFTCIYKSSEKVLEYL